MTINLDFKIDTATRYKRRGYYYLVSHGLLNSPNHVGL